MFFLLESIGQNLFDEFKVIVLNVESRKKMITRVSNIQSIKINNRTNNHLLHVVPIIHSDTTVALPDMMEPERCYDNK